MSFTFPYIPDEVLEQNNTNKQFHLLPEGIYDFYVKLAEEKISSTGNEMIKLTLAIHDENGFERNIFDYLVSTEKMVFKIKQFCEAIGIEDKYKSSSFTIDDIMSKNGKAKITIKKGSQKPDGSFYTDSNAVKFYIKTEKNDSVMTDKKTDKKTESFIDDDLPF